MPSVQELRDTEYASSYRTLELFAYGSYLDYIATPDQYLELSDAQVHIS